MRMIRQYQGLPRDIYVLFLAKIISAVGMFVYPFLTLFLSNRLGFTEEKVGFYLLLLSITYVPAAMIGGKIADHSNRKRTILVGTLFAELALIVSGFLVESVLIVYFIILATFFLNLCQPVYGAMLMDLTTPSNRQESFSLIYLGNNIGGAIGPLIAGLLFVNYTAWIFFGEALLNIVAIILIALYIQETKPNHEDYTKIAQDESRHKEKAEEGSVFQALQKSPLLVLFGLCTTLLTFAYSQISFLIPLQMEDLFGIQDGAKYFGILFSLNCLIVVLGTPILVLLTKGLDPLINVVIVSLLYMAGFGFYGVAEHLSMFLFLTLIWTSGEILFVTNTGVYVANHTPVSHRARFQSVFTIIQDFGRAIGPLIVGSFLMRHSIPQAWLLIALVCGFAAVSLLFLKRHS